MNRGGCSECVMRIKTVTIAIIPNDLRAQVNIIGDSFKQRQHKPVALASHKRSWKFFTTRVRNNCGRILAAITIMLANTHACCIHFPTNTHISHTRRDTPGTVRKTFGRPTESSLMTPVHPQTDIQRFYIPTSFSIIQGARSRNSLPFTKRSSACRAATSTAGAKNLVRLAGSNAAPLPSRSKSNASPGFWHLARCRFEVRVFPACMSLSPTPAQFGKGRGHTGIQHSKLSIHGTTQGQNKWSLHLSCGDKMSKAWRCSGSRLWIGKKIFLPISAIR